MPAYPALVSMAMLLFGLGAPAMSSQVSQPPIDAPPLADAAAGLSFQIDALLNDPTVARAHWGIAITTLDGTPVYQHDAAKLFRPASTAKLFTTAAALALLGPDHRVATRIYGDLDPSGTVQGDLSLVGGGDPSFGTHDLPYHHNSLSLPPNASGDLEGLASVLLTAGVRQITGNILGDDSLFESPRAPEGWADEDLLWAYGALPTALSLGDDELRLTITPPPRGSIQTHSFITTDERIPWLHITNDVLTPPSSSHPGDSVDAERITASPQGVRLFGTLSAGAPPVQQHIAVRDAAAYAAASLQALLAEKGITTKGTARARHAAPETRSMPFLAGLKLPACELGVGGPGCSPSCPADTARSSQLLAEHLSPPLAEDVLFTLKTSANLHAEAFFRQLALPGSCPGISTLAGARVLHSWLLHIGLLDGDVVLYDGSGLSTKDLVTPQAEVQLLGYAATQPWFATWFAALPVGGVDGTLSSRFTAAPLKGYVFAKTGTLGETRALAGYVDCQSGKRLIVSIMVDNHQPGSSADRAVMDQMVAAIAQQN